MKKTQAPATTLEILLAQPSSVPDSGIVGSYDEAPGPVQMAAVHMALITYFGTYDWIRERNRCFPMAYTYKLPQLQ